MFLRNVKIALPTPGQALPGRAEETPVTAAHTVLETPLSGPWPDGHQVAFFAMGCFWGAERMFWKLPGVHSTSVGYTGGITPNPTYEEVCSGLTGHTETVQVVFDPEKISYGQLLRVFWENHDPTQGMRQGQDVGTQYRSAIFVTNPEQRAVAEAYRDGFAPAVRAAGMGEITTEILPVEQFYYAEDYHQQYLSAAKHPNGYCAHGPNGLSCPTGLGV